MKYLSRCWETPLVSILSYCQRTWSCVSKDGGPFLRSPFFCFMASGNEWAATAHFECTSGAAAVCSPRICARQLHSEGIPRLLHLVSDHTTETMFPPLYNCFAFSVCIDDPYLPALGLLTGPKLHQLSHSTALKSSKAVRPVLVLFPYGRGNIHRTLSLSVCFVPIVPVNLCFPDSFYDY